MTDTRPIRVLTVADRAVMRLGMQTALHGQSSIGVVGEAPSVAAAAQLLKTSGEDVALVALCDPMGIDLSPFRAQQRNGRDCKVILIAPHADPETLVIMGIRGAVGYLIEDVEPEVLVEAVRSVHAGGSPMDSQVASFVAGYLRDRSMSADGSQLSLTIDELEILKRIVCGQTNREIGEFLALADSIVKARVSRILRKVGAKNRAAATAWWARYAQFVEAQVEAHADSEVQIPLGKEAQDGSSQL